MKSFAVLLSLVCIVAATPLSEFLASEQQPLGAQHDYPGFDLDLNERRLVQLEGQAPVWMTELEKVRELPPRLACCLNNISR